MSTPENRTLSIQRTLNAPIRLVWEAWTQPERITQWWGPDGMQTEVIEHNFVVGGNWIYKMHMPNGSAFVAEGSYIEIEEPVKIQTTADFKPMTEGVKLYIFFEAEADQTLFTFHVVHPTEAYCRQQEEMGFMKGWGSVFDRLDTFLSAT